MAIQLTPSGSGKDYVKLNSPLFGIELIRSIKISFNKVEIDSIFERSFLQVICSPPFDGMTRRQWSDKIETHK